MLTRPTPFLKTYLGDGVRSGHRAVDQGRAADQVEPPLELGDRPRGRLAEVPLVSVVIPTLNEAANLPHVMSKLPEGIYELILVDGNSTDGTVEVARELYPTVRIVGQSGRGKGNALASGFESCRGEIIVMIDADGSMDPGEIERYVEALVAGADFVKGSRFMEGGGSTDITWTRHLGNLFFTRERVIKITTSEWVVNGTKHAFTATVREGKLDHFELRDESEGGAWTPAPAAAFRFDLTEKVAPSFDEEDQVVLSAWGLCNEGRGSTSRLRATIVVRSFTVVDAPDLSY